VNLVFIGSSKFGLRCLEVCFGLADIKVVGVVTAPRTFEISYRPEGVENVLYADVAAFADSNCIPVRTLERSMNDKSLLDAVSNWRPDAFLVAGWYHMIPKSWRKISPAYGLHASLLPDYSGGAPLVWAIINGESETGITLFQMDDGVDSGPIAGQKIEPIAPEDTIATLYDRIELRGLELLRESLPQIADGSLHLLPQDDSQRRVMPQRGPNDGLIDWAIDAIRIDRFIRAQTRPYPGAFSMLEGKPLHIWKAHPFEVAKDEITPGTVFLDPSIGYLVRCANGALQLQEVSYESRTFTGTSLYQLLQEGGQRLGELPSCFGS